MSLKVGVSFKLSLLTYVHRKRKTKNKIFASVITNVPLGNTLKNTV